MTTIVREFSAAGPCIRIGEFVKRTDKFVMYRKWEGGDRYEDKVRRMGIRMTHTEPCKRCRDHADTTYPNGYMD